MSPAPITPALAPFVLALNNAHAVDLSPLDAPRLDMLLRQAFHAVAVPSSAGVDAFMVALDRAAEYDSPNFAWWRAREPRFLYMDRIAVAAHARGRGLARLLYAGLVAAARGAGHTLIACEVNEEPPNPGSDALHASLGFRVAGAARVYGTKVVRYMALDLR